MLQHDSASQNIYYGSQGDYYTVATNPLRDTVFMGNQRAYDIFGTVCMISSSVLSLGAGALSSGLAAVNAGTSVGQALGVYGAKTAVTFAAAAGGGVAGHEIALGLGASETVADITGLLSGTAVGMAAGFGANAVDKHFNLSGYHTSTQTAAITEPESTTVKDPDALPNVENASIDPKKVTDYALNPDHPIGGNKARVFESSLGYNQTNADDLILQVQQQLSQTPATASSVDQFGQRFVVDMPITGPNGNTVVVRTAWIFDIGSDVARLITIYVL